MSTRRLDAMKRLTKRVETAEQHVAHLHKLFRRLVNFSDGIRPDAGTSAIMEYSRNYQAAYSAIERYVSGLPPEEST